MTPFNISVLSDGTGETALAVLKAVLVQYEHEESAHISRYRNIRTKEQIESLFAKINNTPAEKKLIIFTLILPENRSLVKKTLSKI